MDTTPDEYDETDDEVVEVLSSYGTSFDFLILATMILLDPNAEKKIDAYRAEVKDTIRKAMGIDG